MGVTIGNLRKTSIRLDKDGNIVSESIDEVSGDKFARIRELRAKKLGIKR